MNVWEMGMLMRDGVMLVPVGMRFIPIPTKFMNMLMMLIVYMLVSMLEWLVSVLMLVVFGDMQPNADAHQGGSQPEQCIGWLVQQP